MEWDLFSLFMPLIMPISAVQNFRSGSSKFILAFLLSKIIVIVIFQALFQVGG